MHVIEHNYLQTYSNVPPEYKTGTQHLNINVLEGYLLVFSVTEIG